MEDSIRKQAILEVAQFIDKLYKMSESDRYFYLLPYSCNHIPEVQQKNFLIARVKHDRIYATI